MPHITKNVHKDRCINPYNHESHVGKQLQLLSKSMQIDFSEYSHLERICLNCRNLYYKSKQSDSSAEHDMIEHEIGSDSNLHENDENSRLQKLDEMINGLKSFFF